MPTRFNTSTVDDSGAVRGQVTLVAGNSNLPRIVYTTVNGEVKLAQQTPEGEWILSTLPGEPAARDMYRVSLDIDSRGEPHVAYVSALSDRLIYGVRRESWQFEEVPTEGGLFPGRVRFPSMKLYKGFAEVEAEFKDSPNICYQAAQGNLELRHAAKLRPRDNRAVSPTWRKHVNTVDTASPEAGWFATLSISTDDVIRIAYFDDFRDFGRGRRLHVATMLPADDLIRDRPRAEAAEGWLSTSLSDNNNQRELPELAQSINGELAVSYIDRSDPTVTLNICIVGNFPGSPAVEKIAGGLGGGTVWTSVGASHQFRWCIAYGSGGRLFFATRTGRSTFTIDDVDAGGEWPHLVFDDDGNAQVAHVAGGKLMYAIAPRESD